MQEEAVYDRAAELKAFDETKTGVKGLVDRAVTMVPRIFVLPPEQRISPTTPVTDPAWRVPTLDISGEKLGGSHRQDLVEAIRAACETWGFFQVVGHGVPTSVMERVIEGVGAFNEGEIETKAALYSREPNRAVKYHSNFDLYQSPVANWRDTLYCRMAPDPPSPAELPAACRETMIAYSKHVMKLGSTLFKLLSEALGLHSNYLEDIDCNQGQILLAHYYPPCPEPELTIGTSKHSDSGFLSILIQDQVGGLQILHQDQWVDIHPVSGALVINIGDLLQLLLGVEPLFIQQLKTSSSWTQTSRSGYQLRGDHKSIAAERHRRVRAQRRRRSSSPLSSLVGHCPIHAIFVIRGY